jgi:hypothetical protein
MYEHRDHRELLTDITAVYPFNFVVAVSRAFLFHNSKNKTDDIIITDRP